MDPKIKVNSEVIRLPEEDIELNLYDLGIREDSQDTHTHTHTQTTSRKSNAGFTKSKFLFFQTHSLLQIGVMLAQ
jgi:hypothetical protein